jgi:flagellar hook-associated protein 2
MISSIANSLGFGSGLDVAKLVSDLAAASRTPKVQALDARTRANQAKISSLAQARSDLESFSSSLSSLVAGGTLRSQPSVSNADALSAVAVAGTRAGAISADVTISQLAKSQTTHSEGFVSAIDPIGQGSLTLSVGGQNFNIVIDQNNDSLTGLAGAINAVPSGVKASLVRDNGATRLVLKGAAGAASAFALFGNPGNSDGLNHFVTDGPGSVLSLAQSAQDAKFTVDQISYTRPTNVVSDIISGVELTLKKASVGDAVTIGIVRPSEAIKSAVKDFVSVFNQLKTDIAAARLATGGDQSLRLVDQTLSRLVGQAVTSDPTLNKLLDIGVTTNRDGTLSIDTAKLEAVLADKPDQVEAIFSPIRDATHSEASDPGISGAFKTLLTSATLDNGPLASLKARLDKEASALAKDRSKMEARETAYAARLAQQYGTLDARVGNLKATQTYLDQQIKLWTRSS